MYCNHCGYQSQDNFQFCPKCGTAVQSNPCQSDPRQENPYHSNPYQSTPYQDAPVYETPVSSNPAAQTILMALKDKLFFIICILMSVACGASLLSGSLPLLELLFAIFLWITHSQAQKDVADAAHLRRVSGTVYAQYVITNISAVLVAVCGVIVAAGFQILASDPELIEALTSELQQYGGEFNIAVQGITALTGGVFIAVFLIIGALMFVINLFSVRYLHRFAKSVYQSIQNGVLELKHTSAARIWLYIFGVFIGISALSSLASMDIFTAVSNGANCAVCILSAVLINRYFAEA